MRLLVTILLLLPGFMSFSQSKTTQTLEKRFQDQTRTFFFYHNTLRMINQEEDPELDALIKDIEKMKLLLIRKDSVAFTQKVYRGIVDEYKQEAFEEMMTARHDGKNFDVFVREGKNKGMLVLVNADEALFVLDIVGTVALTRVTDLFQKMDESSEVGRQLNRFITGEF